jgi:putative transposase
MGDLSQEIFAYLATALKTDGAVPICVGGHQDHVHLVFHLSRTRSISETIGTVKSSTSKWMKTKGPNDFAWQAGYAAFSVGRGELDSVVRYVRSQEEHHRKQSFQDEMRSFFEDYGIEYDERYVWD